MTAKCVTIGSQWGVHLSGNFDSNMAHSFKSLIKKPLSDQSIKKISVDFAGVSHLDKFGLHALLDLLNKAIAVGKAVVLLSVNSHIRKIFDCANFNFLFNIR
jgi:anti-anti-sigma factor